MSASNGLMLASLLWAAGTVLTKVALETLDPFVALGIELAVSNLSLWMLIWWRKENFHRLGEHYK